MLPTLRCLLPPPPPLLLMLPSGISTGHDGTASWPATPETPGSLFPSVTLSRFPLPSGAACKPSALSLSPNPCLAPGAAAAAVPLGPAPPPTLPTLPTLP